MNGESGVDYCLGYGGFVYIGFPWFLANATLGPGLLESVYNAVLAHGADQGTCVFAIAAIDFVQGVRGLQHHPNRLALWQPGDLRADQRHGAAFERSPPLLRG